MLTRLRGIPVGIVVSMDVESNDTEIEFDGKVGVRPAVLMEVLNPGTDVEIEGVVN